jgi:hypothetical protein
VNTTSNNSKNCNQKKNPGYDFIAFERVIGLFWKNPIPEVLFPIRNFSLRRFFIGAFNEAFICGKPKSFVCVIL